MKLYRQYFLGSEGWSKGQDNGERTMCWLKTEEIIKVGSTLTLKDSDDPEKWWEVIWVGRGTREAPPEKEWRVGGLNEPRR